MPICEYLSFVVGRVGMFDFVSEVEIKGMSWLGQGSYSKGERKRGEKRKRKKKLCKTITLKTCEPSLLISYLCFPACNIFASTKC